MPLYEFRCDACGECFEELVAPSDRPKCSACGSSEARRSNALRRAREEQRRERREQKKRQADG